MITELSFCSTLTLASLYHSWVSIVTLKPTPSLPVQAKYGQHDWNHATKTPHSILRPFFEIDMHPCMYVLSQLALHPLLRSIFQIDASVNVCYPSYPARELLAHHFGSHSEAFCAASVHVCFPSSKNFTLSLWMYGYGIYDYHQTSPSMLCCVAQDSRPPVVLFGSPRHLSLSLHAVFDRLVGRSPLLGFDLTASLPSLSHCVSI